MTSKFTRLIYALGMLCSTAYAQSGQSVIHGAGDPRAINPVPNCTFTKMYVDDTTGTLYSASGYPCVWAPSSSLPAGVAGNGALGLNVAGTLAATKGFIGTATGNIPVTTAVTSTLPSSIAHYDAFGDSITYGIGSTSCNGSTGDCYVDILARGLGVTATNHGVGGFEWCDVTNAVFMYENPGAASTTYKLWTLMAGTNDANNWGLGAHEAVVSNCENAAITWLTIPSTFKYTGSSFGTVPTSWSLDSTYTANVGLQSTTNGATASWPYTTTQIGQSVLVFYRVIDGNGGQISVTDSAPASSGVVESINNFTIPPIQSHNGGTQSVGVLYLNNASRDIGTYSITTTVASATGAGNVASVLAVAVVPPAGSASPIWVGGTPRQLNDAKGLATATYDLLTKNNVARNQELGLPVNFVDVRSKWFGATSEMASGTDALLHPNTAGHAEIASAFQAPTHQAERNITDPSVWRPYRFNSAGPNDYLSVYDDVVAENYPGGTLTLNLLPGSIYAPGSVSGKSGPTMTKFVFLENFSSANSINFAAGGTNVVLVGELFTGYVLGPRCNAMLVQSYAAPQTYWALAGYTCAGGFALNQGANQQALQLGTSFNTSAFIRLVTGSTIAGWYGFSNTSSGNWAVQGYWFHPSGFQQMVSCNSVTSIITAPAGCAATYRWTQNTANIAAGYLVNWSQGNFTNSVNLQIPALPTTSTTFPLLGLNTVGFATPNIGGSALTAGQCASYPATLTGATTAMKVMITPAGGIDPGGNYIVRGYVSAANTVTVLVCAITAGTPTAQTYNVGVYY